LKGRYRSKPRLAVPDESFVCDRCSRGVQGTAAGTEHRNHCPWCLWSVHVDLRPGDRRSGRRGLMEPIAVWVRHNGEWAVVHRCQRCQAVRTNRIAGDDNELALMSLAVRPLAQPPFPLDFFWRSRRSRPWTNPKPFLTKGGTVWNTWKRWEQGGSCGYVRNVVGFSAGHGRVIGRGQATQLNSSHLERNRSKSHAIKSER